MKSKFFTITFLSAVLTLFITTNAFSVHRVNPNPTNEDTNTEIEINDKKSAKEANKLKAKEAKLTKKMAKVEKKMAEKGIDLDDPVNKWMWFWILGWGAGLVLLIIGGIVGFGGGFGLAAVFGLLSGLAWLFGTVSLIVWIVNKFG